MRCVNPSPPIPCSSRSSGGRLVESRHAGAIAVADATAGSCLPSAMSNGRCFRALRSRRCRPCRWSRAAPRDAFGLGDDELAVACASHSGRASACGAVRSLLAKAGLDESYLACGAHWPISEEASRELDARRAPPASDPQQLLRQACRHARGVQSISTSIRAVTTRREHPLQRLIARLDFRDLRNRVGPSRMGIDGCSVPTWAAPLRALARGFARLGTGEGLTDERARSREATGGSLLCLAGDGRRRGALRYAGDVEARPVRLSSRAAPKACIARHCLGSGSASR